LEQESIFSTETSESKMALQPTGDYVSTLQERRDAHALIGVAPAAQTLSALAEDTMLAATFSSTEVDAILNAHATAINALEVQLEALRAVLVESSLLAEAPE
jgi:hypothetical protein